MGPKCNHKRKAEEDGHKHTEEAEIGSMWPRAKDYWQPPETRRGEDGTGFLTSASERLRPSTSLFQPSVTDFGLQVSRTMKK